MKSIAILLCVFLGLSFSVNTAVAKLGSAKKCVGLCAKGMKYINNCSFLQKDPEGYRQLANRFHNKCSRYPSKKCSGYVNFFRRACTTYKMDAPVVAKKKVNLQSSAVEKKAD